MEALVSEVLGCLGGGHPGAFGRFQKLSDGVFDALDARHGLFDRTAVQFSGE